MIVGNIDKVQSNTSVAIQPSRFVNMNEPAAVLEEVKYNFVHSYPIQEFDLIRIVFGDFLDLYNGQYPGYKKCNTPYHNRKHSWKIMLVFSRIVDGYNIAKKILPLKKVKLALTAILFHDSGYIQKNNEVCGTGAKHYQVHEKKSIEFIRGYFKKMGLTREDFLVARNMIQCTDLKIDPSTIEFKNETEKILGHIVGTADLIGQMSERAYLEKLALLYRELKEGNISGYESEYDLLKKTMSFYDGMAKKRLEKDFNAMYKCSQIHFRERYHIDRDLYKEAMERQLNYLKKILEENTPETYKQQLRRKG